MKYLPLIWKNLWRRKLRTLFTLLSVLVSFLLFAILSAVDTAFTSGVEVSGADRLLTIHKVSLIQPLPISYLERIRTVPGIEAVSHANWFGGIYQDPKNFFGQMAVDAPTFLELYPEYVLPEEQKRAWLADKAGAIVGRVTADRFGWKVGDRIPIQATIYRKQDGTSLWEFNLVGIYDGAEQGTDISNLYFHYDYLNEGARGGNLGFIGWYVLRIADPARAGEVAERVDALFANSPAETKTQTEKAFAQSFADQIGNVGAIIRWVLIAVFFIMLLVTGNTMAQAVRERTNELAVLKTLGFSRGRVLGLVLAESCAIAVLGGGLGLLLAQGAIPVLGKALRSFLPVFFLPTRDLVLGVALILVFGLAAGMVPAAQAMRLRIVEALRRV
ncbi:MAG TPA: FtsX-like permease family protein [Thermoanaerobaculia bacterium]|nr:FtsX-like permease family protein [Thermoanaerobaculia bacterium]